MRRFFECVLVTICFWLFVFLGPALVLLWNNLSYYVSGLGYGPGSLMYKVISFLAQPVSIILATSIAKSVGKEDHDLCIFANCIVGTCACSFLALFYYYLADNNAQLWTMVFSAVSCVYAAWYIAKNLRPANCDIEIELDKCRSENIKLKESLKDQHDATYVLNMIAKRSGLTTTAMAESLYINFRKAAGLSEEAARAELQKEKQNWPQSK